MQTTRERHSSSRHALRETFGCQETAQGRRQGSHSLTHTQWAQRAASYLGDLLRDIVGAVDELAGRDDVHLASGQGDERVGLEIHKVEGDLRDLGDGAVPHQVRV